jgi:archaellum component FlaC
MTEKKCPFALPVAYHIEVVSHNQNRCRLFEANGNNIIDNYFKNSTEIEKILETIVEAINGYYGGEEKHNSETIDEKLRQINDKLESIEGKMSEKNQPAAVVTDFWNLYDEKMNKLKQKNEELEKEREILSRKLLSRDDEMSELNLRLHASRENNPIITSDRDKFKIMYGNASKERDELKRQLSESEKQIARTERLQGAIPSSLYGKMLHAAKPPEGVQLLDWIIKLRQLYDERNDENPKTLDQLRGMFFAMIQGHTALSRNAANRIFDLMVDAGFFDKVNNDEKQKQEEKGECKFYWCRLRGFLKRDNGGIMEIAYKYWNDWQQTQEPLDEPLITEPEAREFTANWPNYEIVWGETREAYEQRMVGADE